MANDPKTLMEILRGCEGRLIAIEEGDVPRTEVERLVLESLAQTLEITVRLIDEITETAEPRRQRLPLKPETIAAKMTAQELAILRGVALQAPGLRWLRGSKEVRGKAEAAAEAARIAFGTETPRNFFDYVCDDETGKTVALCGNGPAGEESARFIATFSPTNVLRLLDILQDALIRCGDLKPMTEGN